MIGAMKSPEAQYQLAMRLPLEQLQAILRGQPSEIDQPTALSVLKQKMQQKTAMQGMQAQQQLQQPSVKDRMLQQSQMPEDMGIAQAPGAQQAGAIPDGGVAGFAEGGDVQHYAAGDFVRSTTGGKDWFLDLPYRQSINPLYSHLKDKRFASRDEAAKAYEDALAGKAAAPAPTAAPVPAAPAAPAAPATPYVDFRRTDVDPNFRDPRGQGATAPAPGPTRRPAANAPVGLEQLSGPDSGYTPPEVTAAAAPAATDTAGVAALSTSAAPAAPAASTDTTYEGEFGKIGSSTKTYTDQMSALLKTMTPTAEEKESRSAERKGVMALKAAQALLQSGTTSGAARGSALGQIAELSQAYGKEDREDKKAMIGAEMNMLGAQAQLAQGNARMAIESFQHAQKLAFEGIRLAADNYYKDIEAKLKKQGLDDNKAAEEARNLTSRYVVDQQAKWHKENYNAEFAKLGVMKPMYEAHARYYDAAAKAAETKGQITAAQLGQLQDKAGDNVRSMMKSEAQKAAQRNKPEFKGMSDSEIEKELIRAEVARLIPSISGGIANLYTPQTNPAFGHGTPPAGANVRP
jgi:hypothetical protein